MKHFVSTLLIGLIALPSVASAQLKPAVIPSPGSYYDPPVESTLNAVATFDGEGEAEVALELAIMNNGTEPITETTLTIAGTNLRLVRLIEETKETVEECYGIQSQGTPCPKHDTAVYKTLTPETTTVDEGTAVKLSLPQAIPSAEGRRIYGVYKVIGYTQQTLGRFHVDLPTPSVPVDLGSVMVNVRVTDGLFLKGGESRTDYSTDTVASGILTAQLDSASVAPLSERFAEQYPPVGLTKRTSSLDPNEVFRVRGSYAERWFVLYWATVLLAVAALALLGGVLWYGERSVARAAGGNTRGVSRQSHPAGGGNRLAGKERR